MGSAISAPDRTSDSGFFVVSQDTTVKITEQSEKGYTIISSDKGDRPQLFFDNLISCLCKEAHPGK